jgi:hypothetical protein
VITIDRNTQPSDGHIVSRLSQPTQSSSHPPRYRGEVARWYFYLCDQIDDSILINGFIRHGTHSHWSQRTWQGTITPEETTVAFDPPAVLSSIREFLNLIGDAAQNRLMKFDLYRRTHTGRMTLATDGEVAEKANARRRRDGQSELPQVRLVSFDPLPPPQLSKGTGSGSPKAPHYRRGTWRNLPNGRARPGCVRRLSMVALRMHNHGMNCTSRPRNEAHGPASQATPIRLMGNRVASSGITG